jgi:hypothetical protein
VDLSCSAEQIVLL